MSYFDPAAAVRAALIRNRLFGNRTDREVLLALMSEVKYCEANPSEYSPAHEIAAWRAEVERCLGGDS